MGRKKERDTEKANFNLDKNIFQRIKELSSFEGLTQSSFIELLVMRWDEGLNPETKLKNLFQRREKIDGELKNTDAEIKRTSEQITLFNDLKRQKQKKKSDALPIIERTMAKGDFQQVENIARTWQRLTGIPAMELILEAKNNLKDRGV